MDNPQADSMDELTPGSGNEPAATIANEMVQLHMSNTVIAPDNGDNTRTETASNSMANNRELFDDSGTEKLSDKENDFTVFSFYEELPHIVDELKYTFLESSRFPYPRDSDGNEEHLSENAETTLLAYVADFIIQQNCDNDRWGQLLVHEYCAEIERLRLKASEDANKKPPVEMEEEPSDGAPNEVKFSYYEKRYLSGENLTWAFVTAEKKKVFLSIVAEILKISKAGNTGVKPPQGFEKKIVVRMVEFAIHQVASTGLWHDWGRVSELVENFYMQALVDHFEEANGEISGGPGEEWTWQRKGCEIMKIAIALSAK
ncbi:hypothetical protein RUND412_001443 [Rhizina undulata]